MKEGVLGLPEDASDHSCWGGELSTGSRKIERGVEADGSVGLCPRAKPSYGALFYFILFYFLNQREKSPYCPSFS